MSNQNAVSKQGNSLKGILNSPTVQKQMNELLNDRSSQFMSSLVTLASNDPQLSDAEPMSIVSGAIQAAQLNLPIEKQFGFVYLIPFNVKEGKTWVKKAQFVLGYRGYIQLAQRSGQYRKINVGNVYEGQLASWNPFTEELDYNPEGKRSDKVIGYFGYFELLNGFKKTVYWTKEEVEKHRVENAKGKNKHNLTGVWKSNYDAMGQKTVLRNMLSKWGILTVELQEAILSDEAEDPSDEEDDVRRDVSENANKELLDFEEPNQIDKPKENVKQKKKSAPASNMTEEQEKLFEDMESLENQAPAF